MLDYLISFFNQLSAYEITIQTQNLILEGLSVQGSHMYPSKPA